MAWDPQLDLRSDRSWEVKKARDVLRLPGAALSTQFQRPRHLTYYETSPDVECNFLARLKMKSKV